MDKPDPAALLDAFALKYGLRYLEHEKHYVGMCRGICVDAWIHKRTVWLYFYSPSVRLMEAILAKFEGFTTLHKAGIPSGWLAWRSIGEGEVDNQGCLLELSQERLGLIPEEIVLEIPEAIAEDFHSHGASAQPPLCSFCGGPDATNPMYANYVYQFACKACFDNLRDFAPGGVVKYDVPICWGRAIVTLAACSVVYTLLWGLLQQGENGVDGRMLLIVPFLASMFLCVAVGGAAQGMSLSLRVITAVCIIACILAGNIWGLHTAVQRQADITWGQAAGLYFTAVIPDPQGNACWFLLGGLVGCWVGFNMLKKQNVVKYR